MPASMQRTASSPMSDGPYIELMGGAYTDNQPDFSGCSPTRPGAFSSVSGIDSADWPG